MRAVKTNLKKGMAEFMHLDLASLKVKCKQKHNLSVHAFAAAFRARDLPLHRLINNAGIFLPKDALTEDDMEIQMQVNYFGHVYLSQLLLPSLAAGSPSRLVWVSSATEAAAPAAIDWDNLGGRGYCSDYTTYARSKLYIRMAAREMQRRLRGACIDVYAVHLGIARTDLWCKINMHKVDALRDYLAELVFCQPAFLGAFPIMHAACAPAEQLPGKGGVFVYGPPYKRIWTGLILTLNWMCNTHQNKADHPLVYDEEACRRLYEASLHFLSEKTGEKLESGPSKPHTDASHPGNTRAAEFTGASHAGATKAEE
ncbi:hypothetical protein WJX72_004522 [[Myrmecia] bisecta]|uniref:Uncharacterized protein n=1 Tax=[Myrmecia] bisecta TaxID=41462 RepID=A0AAW1QEW2_9CHLO